MLTENCRQRDIGGIAADGHQGTPHTTLVVPGIEGPPTILQKDFEPCAEVHRKRHGGNTNVAKIPGGISRRDIHAAAKSDRQMGEVPANAHSLAVSLKGGPIGASLFVVELEMSMHKVADGL